MLIVWILLYILDTSLLHKDIRKSIEESVSSSDDDDHSVFQVPWAFSPMVKCLSPLPPSPACFAQKQGSQVGCDDDDDQSNFQVPWAFSPMVKCLSPLPPSLACFAQKQGSQVGCDDDDQSMFQVPWTFSPMVKFLDLPHPWHASLRNKVHK